MFNNSAVNCSICVKFGTEFDHVKLDVLKCSRSSVRGQCHRAKASADHKIVFFQEIEVAECNGDVRILIGSCEIAVCAHA